MRGATGGAVQEIVQRIFQSMLLMRGATSHHASQRRRYAISIHAPHARSDLASETLELEGKFQSTLLMRGATSARMATSLYRLNFNPRSSCEERRRFCRHGHKDQHISIHAPHARSDLTTMMMQTRFSNFNPRSSCEERPGKEETAREEPHFNPRSSCEERQEAWSEQALFRAYFNPRSSCEERR